MWRLFWRLNFARLSDNFGAVDLLDVGLLSCPLICQVACIWLAIFLSWWIIHPEVSCLLQVFQLAIMDWTFFGASLNLEAGILQIYA